MPIAEKRMLSAASLSRIASVALGLVGIGVVLIFPANLPVAVGAAGVVGIGLWLLSGIAARTPDPRAEKIIEEHKLLVESVERSPIMFAVYDRNDYLIACNDSYEKLYADAFRELRRDDPSRRIHYGDLIRNFSAKTVPAEEMENYVADRRRIQEEASGTAVDRHYDGFGWLRVTKFSTPSGAVAGFAVDINELKQREAALRTQVERSKSLENKLRALANTDALTRLPNRRAFFERLELEFARVKRYGSPLCVVMMDIDNFKSINDVHGHAVGDQVITRLAGTVAAELRTDVDMVGRLGGEEFGVLLPGTDTDGAHECAQRMCQAIAALSIDAGEETLHVTASFGVADVQSSDRSHSECMTRADSALYQAKAQGRNQVAVWRGDAS